MPDWDRPELESWVSTLDIAVSSTAQAPVIVAHSLGCLAVAHWAARGGRARAALLVAVPDPKSPAFPAVARSFAPVPQAPIPFPTRVVASHDDDYCGFAFAERCAKAWGSALTDLGKCGHINAESNLGEWRAGRELLAQLLR